MHELDTNPPKRLDTDKKPKVINIVKSHKVFEHCADILRDKKKHGEHPHYKKDTK